MTRIVLIYYEKNIIKGLRMQDKDIVIIGNGIAAKCVIYNLNKIGFNNITVIASEDFAPMTTMRSTAINSLRGTSPGKSDLGDLILASYKDFEEFVNTEKPKGIYKSIEYRTWVHEGKKHSNALRRYSSYENGNVFKCFRSPLKMNLNFVEHEAYVFSPEIFFEWFESKLTYKLVDDFVININEESVHTQKGSSITYDKLVLCTSYMSDLYSSLVDDPKIKKQLEHSKPVAGTFMKFKIDDFKKEELDLESSYSFVVEDIHFIVRHESRDIILGVTSSNQTLSFQDNFLGLKEKYLKLQSFLDGVLTLPPLDAGSMVTGIRHKGQLRMPFFGQISKNKFGIWALYKNAYTFSFTAGKEIASLIQK